MKITVFCDEIEVEIKHRGSNVSYQNMGSFLEKNILACVMLADKQSTTHLKHWFNKVS